MEQGAEIYTRAGVRRGTGLPTRPPPSSTQPAPGRGAGPSCAPFGRLPQPTCASNSSSSRSSHSASSCACGRAALESAGEGP